MSQRKSRGAIKEDPAESISVGDQLHFLPSLMFPQDETPAVWLKNWESQEGILLSMQIRGTATFRVEGSAVMVAPGIALCAAHVLAPHLDAMIGGSTETICTGITSNGLLIWRIRKVTFVSDSDLAILGLEFASALPPGNRFYHCTISTRLPSVGERVSLLGFRAHDAVEQIAGNQFRATGNVLVCQGTVTARYDTGRDRVFIPWPVIEVDCPSWGGMSGGPAFDSNGNLVGLLSTSFEGENATGPSYISQIWPALTTRFEGGWPSPLFPGTTSLLEMDPRLCAIAGRDSILVVENADGTRTTHLRL